MTNLSGPRFPQGLVLYLASKPWSFTKQSLHSILPSSHVNPEWEPEIKMRAATEDAGMHCQDSSLGMKDNLLPAAGTATRIHPQPLPPLGIASAERNYLTETTSPSPGILHLMTNSAG